MDYNGWAFLRAGAAGLLAAVLLSTAFSTLAVAADCAGHPDALGTSRTLVVDPREHPRIGTMQYSETLPLREHEVVLTFDDGPLPKYSNQVLSILAAECVKATFFVIGRQAQANPEGVRKLIAAGHTVGTHSQNHPLTFRTMPLEKAEQEINEGIASVTAALANPAALAPFFRIPGLLRAEQVEDYLASRGIQVWSADFPADDWRHIPWTRVYQLAMQRLEAKGKGILLLHDIQPRTVASLPKILRDLKARGYRVVHVVPASAERPATPTEPWEWRLHPPTAESPVALWPKIPGFASAQSTVSILPAPARSEFDADSLRAAWPPPGSARPIRFTAGASELPVPGRDLFRMPAAISASVALSRRLPNPLEHRRHARVVSADPSYVPGTGASANLRIHSAGPAVAARGTPHSARRLASLKKRP